MGRFGSIEMIFLVKQALVRGELWQVGAGFESHLPRVLPNIDVVFDGNPMERDLKSLLSSEGGIDMPVVAEFSVTPLVEGEMKPFVDAAVDEVKKSGLKYEVEAMGTTIEGDLDQVLETVKRAHNAVRSRGVHRFFTELRIDDKDTGARMEEEVEDYR